MANLKDLRDRIKSVKSTKKITSAMKMIAAAKLKKAQEAVELSRPYADEMRSLMRHLAYDAVGENTVYPLLSGTGKTDTKLYVLVSSNRGLCGGFNAAVVKKFKDALRNQECKDYKIITIGRKAYDLIKAEHGSRILETYFSFAEPRFSYVQDIAGLIIDHFDRGTFDCCEVLFTQFQSAMAQKPTQMQLIPVDLTASQHEPDTDHDVRLRASYTYEPSQSEILESLLRKNVEVQIFKALLENHASEQGARMTAMDGATRNAVDMLSRLNLTYNRTRQASITNELIEIISGADALK